MPLKITQVKNKQKTYKVNIYGEISDVKYYEEDVTPLEFQDLADLDAEKIDVYINSPGGGVFAGFAIYNILKRHKAKVTTIIDGVAASSAATVFQAGDERIVYKNSMGMIHNPWTMAAGEAKDLMKAAEDLEKISEPIRNIYIEKLNVDKDEVENMMDAETWLTSSEMIEIGFADKVIDDEVTVTKNENQVAFNNVKIDTNDYKNFNIDKIKMTEAVDHGKELESLAVEVAENELQLLTFEMESL